MVYTKMEITKHKSIREFLNSVRSTFPLNNSGIDWNTYLKSAGYVSVNVDNLTMWTQVHNWCNEKFGKDHYAWTGTTFWFENKNDAMWFKLVWQ